KRRTARKRLRRTKKSLWRWCHANRHAPLKYQYQRLCVKLRGHFRYYGIQGNLRLLEEVRRAAEKAWRYWLSRRSSKSAIGWEKFQELLGTDVLPPPRIVHSIERAMQGRTVIPSNVRTGGWSLRPLAGPSIAACRSSWGSIPPSTALKPARATRPQSTPPRGKNSIGGCASIVQRVPVSTSRPR